MDVAIVGGGIGGLTLALALHRHQIPVRVYEAAPRLEPIGAGIVVAVNGMKALDRLDLAASVRAAGFPLTHGDVTDERLRPISSIDVDALSREHGHTNVSIHRARLHEILLARLPQGTVHLGQRLERFLPQKDGVTLRFAGGGEARAALLVGADGLNSVVREGLFPGSTRLRYSGQTSWRGVVPMELPAAYARKAIEVWGPGCRLGFAALAPGMVYWYAVALAPAGERDQGPDPRTALGTRFTAFAPLVGDIIRATPPGAILRTDISDLVPLARWHGGRVCLIGDAAHATTPNLGQGGNQALEDGICLAAELAAARDPAVAFPRFESLRRDKVRYVVDTSWRVGQLAQLRNPLLIALRNAALRHAPVRATRRQIERLFAVAF